jgi:NADPH2:quinone reductase
MYKDCPPLPTVIGYEVVGRVAAVGSGVTSLAVGDRVVGFTRFGGYSQWVVTQEIAAVKISESMDVGTATALATQYSTAWFSAEYQMQLHPGEHVLVQAAAGGVGTALVQIAKMRGCIVYGTAGSDEKIAYLKELGVDHPINYRKQDFFEVISKMRGKAGLDVVFDSLGGKPFKQGYKLLGKGGRIVGFGAASRSSGIGGILGDIKLLFGFGFYNPAFMLMECKAIIGVNMLRIADDRPNALKVCMEEVVKHLDSGDLKPVTGKVFSASELAAAHTYVETRQSIGKVVCKWD